MRVFEVTTEHCEGNSYETLKTVQYVTSEMDTIKSVTDHFTIHCEEYEKELKGIREVLIITEHIEARQ